MKQTLLWMLGAAAFLAFTHAAQASDCTGPWQRLRGYKPGYGGPCAQLGLNARSGTCLPGRDHETLCDERRGGEHRTCQGPRRCSRFDGRRRDDHRRDGIDAGPWRIRPGDDRYQDRDRWRHDRRDWDRRWDGRRDWDHRRDDRDSRWDPRRSDRNCRYWDFDRNRPCPPGFINRDCQGDCGGRD